MAYTYDYRSIRAIAPSVARVADNSQHLRPSMGGRNVARRIQKQLGYDSRSIHAGCAQALNEVI